MSEHRRGGAFVPGKVGQGRFGPISDELNSIEEVFFLCPQLLKAILFG